MAYKYQLGTAILSGAISPGATNTFDLGAHGAVWNDAFISGTAAIATAEVGALIATANLDIGAFDLRASTLTADSLTAGQVLYTGADGVLSAEAGFEYDAGTNILTADKLGAFQAAGAINFDSQAMTSVNIDSGIIDTTTIGVTTPASGSFTMLSSSQNLDVDGNASLNSNVDIKGTIVNFPNVAAAVMDAADLIVSLDSVSKDMQLRTRTSVVSDMAGSNGGLAAAAGVLTVTGSAIVAAAIDPAADSLSFFDYSAGGAIKLESMVDLVDAIAGSGLTATAGVLSSDASPAPTDHGNNNATLVQGFNFSSVVFATGAKTWTLPASPDLGDIVTVKAPSNASSLALTIAGAGGLTIDGDASIIIDSDYGAVALVAASGSVSGIDWYIK
jgi:hypothetical protein